MANIGDLSAALDAFNKRRFEQDQKLQPKFEALRNEVVNAHAQFGRWLSGASSELRWSDQPEVLPIGVNGIFHELRTKKLVIGFAQQELVIAPEVDDSFTLTFRLDGLTGGAFSVRRSEAGWILYRNGDLKGPFDSETLIDLMIADIPRGQR